MSDDTPSVRMLRRDFDLSAPLPLGRRVLLEASAGTGKTYSLTSLVVRYVAERDLAVSELLMVTFTKSAAAELRERTRAKLLRALDALEREQTGSDLGGDASWLRGIVDCSPAERVERIIRLRTAISEIDAAVITTIHGFFQQTLRELGLRSSDTASAEIAKGDNTIAHQVVRDALVARYADGDTRLAEALEGKDPTAVEKRVHEILKSLASNISAELAPRREVDEGDNDDGDDSGYADGTDDLAREWSRFVGRLADEITTRRTATGRLSFDDLVIRLRDIVGEDNPLALDVIAGLRSRFRLVLIDEFQDTDDAQWEVFSRVFDVAAIAAEQDRVPVSRPFLAMILVGDPKQAIYRFRGADIAAYLKAIDDPRLVTFDMRRNHRSDPVLIEALNRLFGAPPGEAIATRGFRFGSEHIAYVQVESASSGPPAALSIAGAPDHAKPLQLGFVSYPGDKAPPVATMRRAIAEDVADHIVLLLDDGSIAEEVDGEHRSRPVRPADICVLVRSHDDADPLVDALRARSVPVSKSRIGKVTESPATEQLRTLLAAIAAPNDARRVRAAALGWFVGSTPVEVLDDGAIVELAERFHRWSKQLAEIGIMGLFQALRADPEVIARLSAAPDAERRLTDLEHLVELLHRRIGSSRPPAANVLRQLQELIDDPDEDDEFLRRVDSDAEAVEITTIHASKGLEYPIVFVPYPKAPRNDTVTSFTHDGIRHVDGAPDVAWVDGDLDQQARKRLAGREVAADELRLLYVAFTRAKHQLLVWWATSQNMNKSPLARLLFGDHRDLDVDTTVPDLDGVRARLAELAQHVGPDLVNLREVRTGASERRMPRDERSRSAIIGSAQPFPAHAAGRWWFRRWSFSALAGGLDDDQDHHAGGADEGAGDGVGEGAGDGVGDGVADGAGDPVTAASSGGFYDRTGLFAMPASAEFGTLVHEVLEVVDFRSPTLLDDLARAIRAYGPAALRGIDVGELAAGLHAAVHTPLDGLLPSRRLADIASGDRLTEMSFDFRIGSADDAVSARAIAFTAAAEPGSVFADYFAALAERWGSGRDQPVGGLLTGSLDLVLRSGDAGEQRYYVVDYKSNRLAFDGDHLDHRAYGQHSMQQAMQAHHYPLQALLYCVALHRFLRGRLAGYDIDRHLGGAGYLFLRGMIGADTPVTADGVNGVFAWRPGSAVVLEIDRMLEGSP